MNTPRFSLAVALLGAATLAAVTLVPNAANAQTATAVTDPVGYLSTPLPANSDTYVSIPFTRPAEFTGAIASVSASTITLAGTPGFTSGAFAPLATAEPSPSTGHKTYYAIIGPKNVALTSTLSVTNNSTAVTASATLPADFAVGDTVTVAGYTFTVAAVSGTTVTIDRAYPGTSATGQAATYNHSPSEGRFYTVTTNDTGSLTVNLNGDSLSNVTAGTQVSVIPYWTFGSLFPSTDTGKSYLASTGTGLKFRGTQILLPDLASPGTNLAASSTYYFYNGAWRQANDVVTTNSHDDDYLMPDTYLIVRNVSSTNVASAALSLTPVGSVLVNRQSIPLHTQQGAQQDNPVGLARPTAIVLNDLGLISSNAFIASTGTSLKTRTDQLFITDNTTIGTNKAAVGPYFYYNNAWRQVDGSDVGSTVSVPAGGGILIRKFQNATASTTFLQNSRNYLR